MKTNAKVEFLAMLEASTALGQELDLISIAKELDTNVGTLKSWVATEAQTKEYAEIIQALEDDPDVPQTRVNPVTGQIEILKPNVTLASKRRLQIDALKADPSGFKSLNNEVQLAADLLVQRIIEAADDDELTTRDLVGLTNALTSIQTAFFNRPVTNVQVNTIQGGDGMSLLSAFKESLKA